MIFRRNLKQFVEFRRIYSGLKYPVQKLSQIIILKIKIYNEHSRPNTIKATAEGGF